MVRHLEWRRCVVLGELDCRHRGGRVELRRFPRRHAQLIAGRAHPGRSVAGQRSHFPTLGHRAVVLYRDSGLVQYMFCHRKILRHDSGGSSEGATSDVGHVWTTPALQEDSDVQLAVGCKSCVRPVCAAP